MTDRPVPKEIEREALIRALETMGMDPTKVCGLKMNPSGMYVDVFPCGPDGKRVFERQGEEVKVVKERFYVRIKG